MLERCWRPPHRVPCAWTPPATEVLMQEGIRANTAPPRMATESEILRSDVRNRPVPRIGTVSRQTPGNGSAGRKRTEQRGRVETLDPFALVAIPRRRPTGTVPELLIPRSLVDRCRFPAKPRALLRHVAGLAALVDAELRPYRQVLGNFQGGRQREVAFPHQVVDAGTPRKLDRGRRSKRMLSARRLPRVLWGPAVTAAMSRGTRPKRPRCWWSVSRSPRRMMSSSLRPRRGRRGRRRPAGRSPPPRDRDRSARRSA